MGMRHRTRPVPVSNSAAPEGAPDATVSGDKKISKTGFGFKGAAKKFKTTVGSDAKANSAGYLAH
jgi:hypothetical protein